MRKTITRSSLLQVLGLVCMTIDHIGSVFFPEIISMRLVGRFAMPVFAYGVALGYLNTKNVKHYILRLMILAVVSVIPHMLALNNGCTNMVFSLLVGLVMLFFLDLKKVWAFVLLACLVYMMNVEYGLYGISLILIYRYTHGYVHVGFVMAVLVTVIWSLYTGYYMQIGAVIPIFAISYLSELRERVPISRMVAYVYYPAHLFVIWLIALFFQVRNL